MAERAKPHTAKPYNLSVKPRIHEVSGENWWQQVVLGFAHKYPGRSKQASKQTKNILKSQLITLNNGDSIPFTNQHFWSKRLKNK